MANMMKVRVLVGVLALLVLVASATGCGLVSDQTKQEAKNKVESEAQQAKQGAKKKIAAGRDDEGSPAGPEEGLPAGLHGQAPGYSSHRESDSRDCSIDPAYTEHCYYVSLPDPTQAAGSHGGRLPPDVLNNERSMALIVEDIIRRDNIEESQDRMVRVIFVPRDPREETRVSYAFKDKAVAKEYAKEYWTERQLNSVTVIDGVYVF